MGGWVGGASRGQRTKRCKRVFLSLPHACLAPQLPPLPEDARLLQSFDEAAGATAAAAAAAAARPGQPPPASAAVSYGPCPLPQLEAFIVSVSGRGGVPGRVRNWAELGGGLLLFNIRANRWCGNVGRAHRSNGVYVLADLQEACWHQVCVCV